MLVDRGNFQTILPIPDPTSWADRVSVLEGLEQTELDATPIITDNREVRTESESTNVNPQGDPNSNVDAILFGMTVQQLVPVAVLAGVVFWAMR